MVDGGGWGENILVYFFIVFTQRRKEKLIIYIDFEKEDTEMNLGLN